MNGGSNQDMEIGVPAWKGTPFAEMVYTTRYYFLSMPSRLYSFSSCAKSARILFIS